ncbi:MAG: helix-turn-helix domain-containing protein, partial [Candidatus Paceibacterota bacterium]
MDEQENRFSLKYIKLEPELFLNKDLDRIHCILFAVIELYDGEDHCYASNRYLANLVGLSSNAVSSAINVLIEKRYVTLISFDGRKRYLKVNEDYKKIHAGIITQYNQRCSDYKETLLQTKRTLGGSLKEGLSQNTSSLIQEVEEDSSSKEEELSFALAKLPIPPSQRPDRKRGTFTQQQEPPTVSKSHRITPIVERILSYWKSKQLYMPREGSKIYLEGVKKIKGLTMGTLLGQKYSEDQIKRAIDNFVKAAFDDDYEPCGDYKDSLRKKPISNFILDKWAKEKSLFQKYVSEEPKKRKGREEEPLEDNHPEQTRQLMSL